MYHSKGAHKALGIIAIVQTSPLVQLPTHRPSGSTIPTMLQYHLGSLRQHRSGDRRNGAARMQTEEMVHMAMFILRIIDILRPPRSTVHSGQSDKEQCASRASSHCLRSLASLPTESCSPLRQAESHESRHGQRWHPLIGRCSGDVEGTGQIDRHPCDATDNLLPEMSTSLGWRMLSRSGTSCRGYSRNNPKVWVAKPWTGEMERSSKTYPHWLAGGETEDVAGYRCGPATGTVI